MADENRVDTLNTEYRRYLSKILFWGERGTFCWAKKTNKKNNKTHSSQHTEPGSFWTTSLCHIIRRSVNSDSKISIGNNMCRGHLQSEAGVENKENTELTRALMVEKRD